MVDVTRSMTVPCAILLCLVLSSLSGAAETLRKLKGAEIKARLAGMELTDDVHWAEQYMRDGTLKSFHMGKATTEKWWVDKDLLCSGTDTASGQCHEFWSAGNKVELRVPGSTYPREAILQKQQQRGGR